MRAGLCALGLAACVSAHEASAQSPTDTTVTVRMVPRLTIHSVVGYTNEIQFTNRLGNSQWQQLTQVVVTSTPYELDDLTAGSAAQRFYRVLVSTNTTTSAPPSTNMVTIPGGSFTMGDFFDGSLDAIQHVVTVSTFQMDATDVTYDLWRKVYDYATANGYAFDNLGMGKATNHPVQHVNWYDAVKWCNARSEMEGLTPCYYTDTSLTVLYKTGRVNLANTNVNWSASGYRLPTEAQWEKAARGGVSGHRFPWSDTDNIAGSRANYLGANASIRPVYDKGPVGYNPLFSIDPHPYTSPGGAFAPNGYGLYDMAGNVFQWCWDWYYNRYYNATLGATDPPGPLSSPSTTRVQRGGSWSSGAGDLRCMKRGYVAPTSAGDGVGFRCVRNAP